MPVKFLLVTRPEDTAWPQVLSQALAPLGTVETVSEADAAERMAQYQCDAITIVDATAIKDTPALVSRLRRRCPESRIVVATASPTWQHAREAFQAGAVDYIRKSWNSGELLRTIKEVLDSPLPPADEFV